jgi:hypothetical protein
MLTGAKPIRDARLARVIDAGVHGVEGLCCRRALFRERSDSDRARFHRTSSRGEHGTRLGGSLRRSNLSSQTALASQRRANRRRDA